MNTSARVSGSLAGIMPLSTAKGTTPARMFPQFCVRSVAPPPTTTWTNSYSRSASSRLDRLTTATLLVRG
jgi:hypothetical protein